MNFGCWNVQGIRTKDIDVFKELSTYDIDIVALSETKKKGEGNETKGDYIHFYSGVGKEKRAKAGISIAIKNKYLKNIKNWSAVNERIITMELKLRGHDQVIVGVYAPTDDATIQVKENFFEELGEVIRTFGNRRDIFLLGDFNGRVGKKKRDAVIGEHGEKTLNDNGTRLIELCQQHSLKIQNGFFKHKEIHKYTWEQKTKNLKSIIDYCITKQQTRLKIIDVVVKRGAICGSDHHLLKTVALIKHKRAEIRKENETLANLNSGQPTYKLDSFFDDSTVFLYKLRLAEKMKNKPIGSPEQMYETLKKHLHEAAKEALGEKEREKRKKHYWWNEELEDLIKEKKELYNKWLATNDPEDRQMYRRYCYIVKKEVIKRKNNYWERKCQEIDGLLGSSKSRTAWKTVKTLKTNRNEKVTIDPIEQDTWKQYYKELLTEDRVEFKNINYDPQGFQAGCDLFTIEEIKKSLSKMKNNKSPGPGGIPVELLKFAPEIVLENLTEIFNKCLNGEEIPSEWKLAYISSIYKKGNKKDCRNYRGISVTASTGRLYGRVLRDRLESQFEDWEEQSGFRPGRSCIDNLFCIKQLIEKTLAYGSQLHMVFVDLRKAYDSVPVNNLWVSLAENGIHPQYINAVKNFYKGNFSCIKTRREYSANFEINKGLRQGCCLSPTLFKIYINSALKHWFNKCKKMGVQIGEENITTILFADDQVVLAEDEEDLTYMVRKLVEEFKKWGLEMNMEKTEYMAIGSTGEDLDIDGEIIKNTKEYKYLGVTLTDDGNDEKDILQKMGRGRAITSQLNSILWNKNIQKTTKKHIFTTIVESTVTYGSEVWTINKNMQNRINTVENSYWRRCCGYTLLDHIRTDRIKQLMNIERSLTDTIEKKQLAWYGHMRRMPEDRLPTKAWKWTPNRRRRKGRPKKSWDKGIEIAMSRRDIEEGLWRDKKRWRLNCDKRPRL